MPRQPRQFEINGIYHVVKRGVEKRKIFLKPQDYHRFILGLEFCNTPESTDLWALIVGSDPPIKLVKRLEEKRKMKNVPIVEVLAFTLMPNHFHVILREIKEGGISQFMQKMGGYSTYFNKQYDRVGTLFQSRFRAVRIQNDVQLNAVFAYVHTNPVELWEPGWKEHKVKNPGRAIKELEGYWASSYNDYIGEPKFLHVVDRNFFLDFYGSEKRCREVVAEWIRFKAGQTEFGQEIIE